MVGKGRQHNLPEGHELLGRGRRQRLQGLAGLTVLIRQVFRILSPRRVPCTGLPSGVRACEQSPGQPVRKGRAPCSDDDSLSAALPWWWSCWRSLYASSMALVRRPCASQNTERFFFWPRSAKGRCVQEEDTISVRLRDESRRWAQPGGLTIVCGANGLDKASQIRRRLSVAVEARRKAHKEPG